MSENTDTSNPKPESCDGGAEIPSNVVTGDFSSPAPAEPTAEHQQEERPLSGTGLPDAYVKALEKANTHHIFGEIKNHVANFGYTMLSGFKALEHILLRDQESHADASAAWERVKEALIQAGAKFEEEEQAITNWLRISDPRPPIVVQPQAHAQEATSTQEPPAAPEVPSAETPPAPEAASEPQPTAEPAATE